MSQVLSCIQLNFNKRKFVVMISMKGQASRVAFLINGIKQKLDNEGSEGLEEMEITSDPGTIRLELEWKAISYDNLLTIQT